MYSDRLGGYYWPMTILKEDGKITTARWNKTKAEVKISRVRNKKLLKAGNNL